MFHKKIILCISNRASANYRSTPYSVYSPETYEGHWKQLTVRTSRNGHIMAIAYFNPQVFPLIYNVQPRLTALELLKFDFVNCACKREIEELLGVVYLASPL